MNILFVYPNVLMSSRIPLNLAILISIVKSLGHTPVLFDSTFMKESNEVSDDEKRYETFQVKPADLSIYGVDWEVTDIKEKFNKTLANVRPDLVFITLTENMFPLAQKIFGENERIQNRGFIVVAGGVLPTSVPEEIIDLSWVDIACIGEGENAVRELINHIDKGKSIQAIQNLWVKDVDGLVIKNSLRPLIDLDSVPYQDWELFDENHIWRPLGGKVYRTGNFMLSRGCPNACTFRINNHLIKLYKGLGKYHRELSPLRAVEEIKYFHDKYQLELIQFHDENFLLKRMSYLDEFVTLYKKRIGLPFSIVTHANTVNEEVIQKIVEAGCINIAMSIESGSSEIREKVFKRKISNGKIIAAFEIVKKTGIRVSTSNIIGNPFESREQIFETIMLNRQCNPDAANVNFLYPYKGTQIYDVCVDNDFFSPKTIVNSGGVRMDPVLDLPQISKEALKGLQRTFLFYVRFPENYFSTIRRAEQLTDSGDQVFNKLSAEYKEKFGAIG
jgi:anaerobic magnesium-protoporphyrin IX monomethyl ester cyclase